MRFVVGIVIVHRDLIRRYSAAWWRWWRSVEGGAGVFSFRSRLPLQGLCSLSLASLDLCMQGVDSWVAQNVYHTCISLSLLSIEGKHVCARSSDFGLATVKWQSRMIFEPRMHASGFVHVHDQLASSYPPDIHFRMFVSLKSKTNERDSEIEEKEKRFSGAVRV